MIRLGKMKWSNAFSYGEKNEIDFSQHELVQLIGKNGHGKSSIALILEEVLYNKNSKGIKKADILNRYGNFKTYTIRLEFTKENHTYVITTVRGASQTVQLSCDGVDISAHTSTGTYKLIEDIIGFDHKTFTQIVYQSSAYSLEFLVATDTNRKKFLIDLLNLSIYTKASDLFKGITKEVGLDCEAAAVKVKTVTDWLTKFSKEPLTRMEIKAVPLPATEELAEVAKLKNELTNIDATNKKIAKNNEYKRIQAAIVLTQPEAYSDVALTELKILSATLTANQTKLLATIKGTGPILTKCGSCGQPIDSSHKAKLVEQANIDLVCVAEEIRITKGLLADLEAKKIKYDKAIANQADWERYHSLIDPTMPTLSLDKQNLTTQINTLQSIIDDRIEETQAIQKHNTIATANNTRVDVLLSQIETMELDLRIYSTKLEILQERLSTLSILQKTFSTTGLVAYKIECLVKDLEQLTNDYLLDMSDGRFQISFKVNSSDKLNVIITDNGRDIDILALSNGERARVNVATLLAIRKLMQSLSNSRINLLVLDETVESLDTEGKEKLIEVLLKEEYLNTILISHGFTHPLLEKINIVKENNISRME